MKKVFGAALAAAICVSTGLAAEPSPPPAVQSASRGGENAEAPHENDAGALVAYARGLRDEKGCAAAAAAYRVVAAMGEGEEAAQHELGECLLNVKGANDIETALFRQEGEFWLTRAAFAGNARAQRKLAMEMASPASALHNPKGALMWALIYDDNPTAELYGYKALPSTLAPGLRASLGEGDIAEAEAFAKDFAPILLAKYEGPKRDRTKPGIGERPEGPPPGGRRKRPG